MLEALTKKLQNVLNKIKNKGKIDQKDIEQSLKEIKLALLEADVNYKVVKDFITKLEEKASVEELSKSLTPGQQMIKITNSVLTDIMGCEESKINIAKELTTVILLVGLQGSGKTTTAAKLALNMANKGFKPLLVAADKIRPAAIEQLQIMGKKAGIEVFTRGIQEKASYTRMAAKQFARENKKDLIIIDTAGRLHIDKALLQEIKEIKNKIDIHETLLVLDSLMGQDALRVANNFNEEIGVDGFILTKLDGDSRGGIALSIRHITDIPIKFVGVGEKVDDLDTFYPDRMSSRILGMGDTLTLIEKIEKNYNRNEIKNISKKEFRDQFNLNDFYDQLKKIKNMGSIEKIIDLMPIKGLKLPGNMGNQLSDGEKGLEKVEAIICSMTKKEKQEPEIINGRRRRRIALGSGTKVADVNRLLKQFFRMKKMLKKGFKNQSWASLMR